MTLLDDHCCIVDATDGAREVGTTFELLLAVPAMSTSDSNLSKSESLLSSFFRHYDREERHEHKI